MKWISERISVKKHANFTTIVISPTKNFWTTLLLGSWLSMWFVIGVLVISSFYMFDLKNQEKIILWIFLSFLVFYFFRIAKKKSKIINYNLINYNLDLALFRFIKITKKI
jgi:hypothetical protein